VSGQENLIRYQWFTVE